MALLDFFKKKPAPAETKERKEEKEVEEKKVEEPKKEIKEEIKKEVKKKKKADFKLSWKVLKEPHISEKATDLTKENKYIFRVFPDINKKEVKKSVEDLYGVDVLDVKIINLPRKQKRRGRVIGWRKGYKKAVVKLKEGQKIELLPR